MILVVGGTGSLGGRVVEGLLERGETVRCLVRQGSDHRRLEKAGAELAFGDLKEPQTLGPACQGVEVVITTANSAKRGGEDTTETVDREGNRTLIDAARAAGVKRFVFVSALGADPESPVPLMRAKSETEAYLRASGLEYTVMKPNIFMDTWFRMLVEGPMAERRPVTLVGEAKRRHAFVAEMDVARFIVAAVRSPEARNATIVVGGPEALSWRDVVRVYEEASGRSLEVEMVPPGTALPGVPDVVSGLAASFETYDSEVPMDETCRAYGVALTPASEFARRLESVA